MLSNSIDELALLFTGSRVQDSQKTTDSTQTVVEDEDVPNETQISSSLAKPPQHNDTNTSPSKSGQEHATFSQTVTGGDSVETPYSGYTDPPKTHPILTQSLQSCPPQPMFGIEQLGIDRRLLINRKRQLKMYRVWMQGKFRKLDSHS